MGLIALIGAAAVIIAAVIIIKKRSGKKQKQEEEMPAGIQIFNANQSLTFDLANRTTYVLGSGSTGTAAGSLSDSRIVADRTWVAITSGAGAYRVPAFYVSAGQISWNFPATYVYGDLASVDFIYGVWS